ncbi:GH36-type glycosyl hydrolase domain-containing protein [Undibacterium arcticum]|uniref:GH36-type glycosyl hydrolase domain-containing protein n=1 Tax=Undibacterium arcticum TaxID=1762892 RepID=A0ABV7F6S0_9BURK
MNSCPCCANGSSRSPSDKQNDAIEQSSWDGDWCRRARFDHGSLLSSAKNSECRFDSIPRSWSVLSGAGNAQHARQAMDAVDRQLVRRKGALIQLLDPRFDQFEPNPGYIKGHLRGVRENGDQYTHAAVWAAMAFASAIGRRLTTLPCCRTPRMAARD